MTPSTKIKLIFRASRDGWDEDDFSEHCNNKGPTLILIKSSVGKVFGGFTKLPWSQNEGVKSDDSAFLFSVSLMKKFPCTKPELAIYHKYTGSPSFNYRNLSFASPMNTKAWSSFPDGGNQNY